jgi:hypothetical protein
VLPNPEAEDATIRKQYCGARREITQRELLRVFEPGTISAGSRKKHEVSLVLAEQRS